MRLFAAGLLVAFGLSLAAVGLGAGGIHQSEPRPMRSATVQEHLEHQLQDLHADLKTARECIGQPRDTWPCSTVATP